MALQSYRGLKAWQRAIDLVEAVYQLARSFPTEERFGLTSQIQRAAVSIAGNIAEGYGRTHRGDYLRHLSYSRGSLFEVETYLIIAKRLEFVEREKAVAVWSLAQEVGRLLTRLIASLRQPSTSPAVHHPEP